MSDAELPLLAVEDLAVTFRGGGGEVAAVRGVSFSLRRGETLALVGESGSGKSVTALSILRLLPYPAAHHPSGSIRFESTDLLRADEETVRRVRGARIAMVFQEPMTSLNPLHTIEKQIAEALYLHAGLSRRAARPRVLELLHLVGIGDAERRLGAYPHELSGGQRQRVMIAMALANEPDLLIADEPTTALDVTIQAQILDLLKDLQRRFGMALLLITHDFAVVRKMADRVAVMRHGQIVETGPTTEVFTAPQHDYTRTLIAAQPAGTAEAADPAAEIILQASDLRVQFALTSGFWRRAAGTVRAVDGVDVAIRVGQTLGVVGESGSGKTTLGLALLRLIRSQGRIVWLGRPIDGLSPGQMRPLRREMQIVFQDPYGSLSPRMSIGEIIAEGLLVHRRDLDAAARDQAIITILQEVGLDPDTRHRYPHEFSGGQRQRVAIARAMILRPKLVVLDEPTSALDMSVQAQIVALLRGLQQRHGLAYMFISHDLKVVRALAHQVLVMKDGKIVERGATAEIFDRPQQPYTKALIAAALDLRVAEAPT